MSENKRSLMSHIFIAMMSFCGLVWMWTVVFILAWPWEKGGDWKPEFRLPAVCAQGEVCSVSYGQLADAKAQGKFTSLLPPDDGGEVQAEDAWVRWKKAPAGQPWQIESKASSWYFQTTVRYRLDNDTPVLVEYQEVGAKSFYYGMGLAGFSLLLFYLRRLRK
jgi:hypothetical protein